MTPPHEAIRNLLGRYSELFDAGNFDELGRMFTHGVLLDEIGREVAAGAAAATELWTALIRLYHGSPRTRHMASCPIIDVDGDRATARSTYVVFQEKATGKFESICGGRHLDSFEVVDGAWCFTSRQYFLDQIGDMSQHLVTDSVL